jgi:hypothetical protein
MGPVAHMKFVECWIISAGLAAPVVLTIQNLNVDDHN